MDAATELPWQGIDNHPHAEIAGMRAVYVSADAKQSAPPAQIRQAVDTCSALDADAIAIERDDCTLIAVLNRYDDHYAAAVCDAGISLPAVARSLQMRLLSPPVPGMRPDLLPAATVRAGMARWERKIAVIFGDRYAARLVAGLLRETKPDAVTAGTMEAMHRALVSATGGCIDLPAAPSR